MQRTREALKVEGFGVLTEIDMQAAFKEKLGRDFRPSPLLGACNPPLAFAALSADPEVGLMLPCNVTVEAADDGGSIGDSPIPYASMRASAPPRRRPSPMSHAMRSSGSSASRGRCLARQRLRASGLAGTVAALRIEGGEARRRACQFVSLRGQ